MRKENILLLLLAVTVLLIFLFPSLGWNVRYFMASSGGQNTDSKNIALENQSLKAELAKSRIMKNESSPRSENLLQTFVYSDYPLNFKSQLLLNAGENNGVKSGQPVFISTTSSSLVLAGRIKEVYEKYSVAETIFSSNFQISVKVGNAGVSSLLKGGNNPSLTLIPKDAKIEDGDAVFSSSQDYPFGMALGLVRKLRLSPDQFFNEADLEVAYNSNDFQTVFIDISYDKSAK